MKIQLQEKNQWTVKDYLKEQNLIWKPYLIDKTDKNKKSLIDVFPEKINFNMYPKIIGRIIKKKNIQRKYLVDRIDMISQYFNIDKSKVIRLDHHTCHAFTLITFHHLKIRKCFL